jgi:hypothetical protein
MGKLLIIAAGVGLAALVAKELPAMNRYLKTLRM